MEDSENLETSPGPSYLPPEPPSRRRLLIPVIAILVVVVASLMAVKASFQRDIRSTHERVELTEGSEIPNLELIRMDESKVRLGDLPHKVMLINFWATWCEACMEEMPSLVQLREKFVSRGFEILGVNVDENPIPLAVNTAKKLGINFPMFTDKSGNLGNQFDLNAIPLTVVINKNRKILMVEAGGREWNTEDVHQLIEKWLAE
ncbi:MAG: TlpA family protein disulfide reductase [Proteobacteria bacterium]|nr:TlpA family protein disulfide reductase [Pseudomonadota bacterium]